MPVSLSIPLPSDIFFSYPLVESLYEVQRWVQDQTQAWFDRLYADPWNWSTSILIAPVYEELLVRGPMYLARGRLHALLWWLIGSAGMSGGLMLLC